LQERNYKVYFKPTYIRVYDVDEIFNRLKKIGLLEHIQIEKIEVIVR